MPRNDRLLVPMIPRQVNGIRDGRTVDEDGIENHPDLMDPDWQRHAEKEAWVGFRQDRRRAHRRKWVTMSAVVVVVVAGAGVGLYLWGRSGVEQSTGEAGPDAVAAVSTSVATTTTAPTDLPDYAHVDLTRPFDNTPAQNWTAGIAGLTVAPATKVGAFSAAQVKQAEDQVKQAITAAQFDPDTLDGHHPDKYVALLAPDDKGNVQTDPGGYVTYLADGLHLLPVPPRMTGTMTAKPRKAGELVLHTSYVVAYAFDPGTRVIYGPGDLEPFVRVEADYVVRSGSSWRSGSRGLWVEQMNRYLTGIACRKDHLLAPAFTSEDYTAASLSPEPGRFDPAKPVPTGDNCND
ncbi:hypothetical protein VSH64_45085 [Amycolatopsis rhabdoformis]|uniref:Uncharacterized protein n=1 Tax=Amycolatopsis rhabdoformis TaxID=1448059 RepID=A0ABZ1I6B8_9PSEU|nr:hypothetical protein [Amycolatopsis rhabdoformis]WSE29892.1 hypothetical protein VSH64_45085 [Amycolatopsis rhabdoformis]